MIRFKGKSIALYTIVYREVIRFFRIWTQTLVPPVITMSLYFIIFGNLIGSRIGQMGGFQYIEYIVPGLIMMSVITNAYANVVSSFFSSKFQRNLEELLVSPTSNVVIIWGYVLGGVARGMVVGILVTLTSLFFTKLTVIHIGLTILVGFLTAILFSIAGLTNGVFAKKFDDVNVVPTFILTPLTYLGGVFYSISLLPEFWQKLSYINPIFYIVNAFRYTMLGYSDVSITTSLLMITSFIVVLYSFCLWLLNKGIGIRT
jgi:ABC-2 type transport system permease protein